jgi:hypothetical protein
VAKLNLISRLQALLQEGRLKILRSLPEAEALVRELQHFQAQYTDAGHMTFNARSGRHDDLVLALAIAAWYAHRGGGAFLRKCARARGCPRRAISSASISGRPAIRRRSRSCAGSTDPRRTTSSQGRS